MQKAIYVYIIIYFQEFRLPEVNRNTDISLNENFLFIIKML